MVGGLNPNDPAGEITKAIDDATEALRWCRLHLHERRAGETLRLVQLNLASLALALDCQMEGEKAKATSAMDRIWWEPHKDDGRPPQ